MMKTLLILGDFLEKGGWLMCSFWELTMFMLVSQSTFQLKPKQGLEPLNLLLIVFV